MLAQLTAALSLPKAMKATHLLVLLPKGKTLPKDLPYSNLLAAVLRRRGIKTDQSGAAPVAANTAGGGLIVWAMLDQQDHFCRANTGAQGRAVAAGRAAGRHSHHRAGR